MMALLLAPGSGNLAPIWIPLVLFPLVFLGASLLSSRLLGVFQLYRDFPADQTDPIETNLGWIQIEFGVWRGHSPMSLKAGRRCLNIKQPFPFQPLFWLGPASIPWEQIRVMQEAGTDWWAFWKAAEFALGPNDRRIRIRGRAARKVQAQVEMRQGRAGNLPLPAAAIQPR